LPGNVELSTKNSKVKIYKIETAEELVIARDTYKLTKE
jgi:acetate kinase